MAIQWVSREAWKAARARGAVNATPKHVYGVAVHYSGVDVGQGSHSVCGQQVRGIQRHHMVSRGWADIGYSFLICRHGSVFVGRGTSAGPASQGTTDGNLHWWSVCFLQGPHDVLTPESMAAFASIREYLIQRKTGVLVRPHSAFITTLCPGRIISSWLRLRYAESG